ncbi:MULTISPECIES: PIN domain-containing protein [Burkholderia]|uniref:PIN domain-containing protein n=1 Tax=Burkholderia TaxID=32008 RepID=UPI001FC7FEE1|nr:MULTISPECIES: PIN domain-containing protein [Burkholderia]
MKLHLLIDTCVWLDLAKDYRQLPLLDAVLAMKKAGELELVLPQIVVEEFNRNKERIISDSKRSLSSHFKLVREAMLKFSQEEGRDAALQKLNEVDHRIAIGGEAVNDATEIIEEIFASTDNIALTDAVKARAADRAIAKTAPFHRQRNGIDDAILIESYIDALAARSNTDDVYGFVTHNIHDFSDRSGDSRLPHPDLAAIFDNSNSRYATSLGPLLGEFAEDMLDVIKFEREFNHEPRKLSELLEAEHRLFKQVWYNRHWNLRTSIERGKHKLVSSEAWEKLPPKKRINTTIDTVWEGALAAAKRTEDELGPDGIGPWSDFEWGMINGKLSAIRWMLGDDWDMLDT